MDTFFLRGDVGYFVCTYVCMGGSIDWRTFCESLSCMLKFSREGGWIQVSTRVLSMYVSAYIFDGFDLKNSTHIGVFTYLFCVSFLAGVRFNCAHTHRWIPRR